MSTTHEKRPDTLWAKYRAKYETLPPGAQMIGLQLWLPFVFVLAFCFCYIAAFHAPAPDHVPVAVVGSGSQVESFASQLQSGSGGALEVSVEPDRASASSDVRSGELAAAYVPGGSSPTLIMASADQYQLAATAKATFQGVAAQQQAQLTIDDLAPLPAHDAYGTTLFYLTLVWTIGGYMTAMFVGMMGAALSHRVRFSIVAGSSVVVGLLSTVLVRFALGAVTGHFWALWGLGAATALAIGLVVNGLGYFFGRFVTAIALIVFVFANIPSSGGAYPPEFVPEPFKTLHSFVSATGTLDALKSVVYGVGPGVGRGLLILGGYAVVGLLLSLTGKRFFAWKQQRRAARGTRPSMMITAQMSAMAAAAAANPQSAGAHEAPEGDEALTVEQLQARRDEDEANARRSSNAAAEADGDVAAAVTGAAS